MRILIFCDSFFPRIGGLENHVRDISHEYIKLGHEVFIITPNQNHVKTEETIDKIKIFRIPAISIFGNRWSIPNFFALWHIANNLPRPDIINSHTRFFFTSVFAVFFAKIKKIPNIHTEHGAVTPPLENFFLNFSALIFDHTLGRFVLRFSTAVIAISDPVYDFVHRFRPDHNIFKVSNGINIKKFTPPKNIKRKKNRIIFVGRIVRAKGLFELVEACSLLQTKYKLVIIGDGCDLPELKSLAKKRKVNAKFLGKLETKEITKELWQSQIFVNPSYAEGFCLSILEACCAGCACVGTPVGEIPIILGKNRGIIVPIKNTKKLKYVIEKLLLDESLCKKMSIDTNKFVCKDYNLSVIAEKTINIFKKSISHKAV